MEYLRSENKMSLWWRFLLVWKLVLFSVQRRFSPASNLVFFHSMDLNLESCVCVMGSWGIWFLKRKRERNEKVASDPFMSRNKSWCWTRPPEVDEHPNNPTTTKSTVLPRGSKHQSLFAYRSCGPSFARCSAEWSQGARGGLEGAWETC